LSGSQPDLGALTALPHTGGGNGFAIGLGLPGPLLLLALLMIALGVVISTFLYTTR
jgi:hypothetical protein